MVYDLLINSTIYTAVAFCRDQVMLQCAAGATEIALETVFAVLSLAFRICDCERISIDQKLVFEIFQLAHRPLPYSRSARVAMRAYNRCTARLIPLSWLQEWCCKRGDYVV